MERKAANSDEGQGRGLSARVPRHGRRPLASLRAARSRRASVAEFTPRAIALGSVFGIIFGAATVYLALKAGLTVSASIPVAVLSIAVFKKLGKSTILENNIVQTIGSAGESIAVGRRVHAARRCSFSRDGGELLQLPDDPDPRAPWAACSASS